MLPRLEYVFRSFSLSRPILEISRQHNLHAGQPKRTSKTELKKMKKVKSVRAVGPFRGQFPINSLVKHIWSQTCLAAVPIQQQALALRYTFMFSVYRLNLSWSSQPGRQALTEQRMLLLQGCWNFLTRYVEGKQIALRIIGGRCRQQWRALVVIQQGIWLPSWLHLASLLLDNTSLTCLATILVQFDGLYVESCCGLLVLLVMLPGKALFNENCASRVLHAWSCKMQNAVTLLSHLLLQVLASSIANLLSKKTGLVVQEPRWQSSQSVLKEKYTMVSSLDVWAFFTWR